MQYIFWVRQNKKMPQISPRCKWQDVRCKRPTVSVIQPLSHGVSILNCRASSPSIRSEAPSFVVARMAKPLVFGETPNTKCFRGKAAQTSCLRYTGEPRTALRRISKQQKKRCSRLCRAHRFFILLIILQLWVRRPRPKLPRVPPLFLRPCRTLCGQILRRKPFPFQGEPQPRLRACRGAR